MRQPISWSALADASVGVWGLGVEGQASIRRLRAMGRGAILVDDAPTAPAFDGEEVRATARGGLAALRRCDVVIKSPGISRYRPEVAQLEQAGVAVCGGLGLFMAEADPTRVACITGTKGKSTTTAIAVHLLNGLGVRAGAGGNIGRPPWDPAVGEGPDYWIIETSSFQVPDLQNAPAVVAVTSLSPDHLDWHGTVERYYADKLSLCTKPGVTLALADGLDEELQAQAGQLGPHLRWVGGDAVERDARWSAALGLPGPHNRAQRVDGTRRARGPRHRRRVGRGSVDRSGAGIRGAAQPLSFSRARSAPSNSSTTVCRPTCCRRRRRCRPSPTARWRCSSAGTTADSTTRRSDGRSRHARGTDARRHDARQRAPHRAGRPRGRGRTAWRSATPRVWTPPSRRRSHGPRPVASYCCHRPRRASAASGTTGSARRPSPKRRAARGCSAEQPQQGVPTGASSSRSLRNSHHESADTVAAAWTTSRLASSAVRASIDHPAWSTSWVRCTSQKRVPPSSKP